MIDVSLVFLLVLAIGIGWLLGRREGAKQKKWAYASHFSKLSSDDLHHPLAIDPEQALRLLSPSVMAGTDELDVHFVLAGLFLREGDVDRAIKIHQDLLARPHLILAQQNRVRFALAQDYLVAGLFDRAERLLLGLLESPVDSSYRSRVMRDLLRLYEQEKEWDKAVEMSVRLLTSDLKDLSLAVAHYCCEAATERLKAGDFADGRRLLNAALQYDARCARSQLLLAQLDYDRADYLSTIKLLQKIRDQSPQFIPETLTLLHLSYQHLGKEPELVGYLKECLQTHPSTPVLVLLAECLCAFSGVDAAIQAVENFLEKNTSFVGLQLLMGYQLPRMEGVMHQRLQLLHTCLLQLNERRAAYHCHSCGFSGKKIHWQCPGCRRWNAVQWMPEHSLNDGLSLQKMKESVL